MTPKAFMKKYVTLPLDDYVCLVHDPRKTSPVGRTFTVEYLGNVVEGGLVTYLNVDLATMKDLARKALKAKEPVWFGCDCSKMMHRDLAVWDARMFEPDHLYGTELELASKEDRLLYKRTAMNHAMLFTGVDEEAGQADEVARGEQLGRQGRGQGLLRHERLVVRRAHVRDRGPEEPAARRPARGARAAADRAAGLGPDGIAGGVARRARRYRRSSIATRNSASTFCHGKPGSISRYSHDPPWAVSNSSTSRST